MEMQRNIMGKKLKLTHKKGKKQNPNVSDRKRMNLAIQDFKSGKSKAEISVQYRISRSKLDRYLKHFNIKKGDQDADYELLPKGRHNFVNNICELMAPAVES